MDSKFWHEKWETNDIAFHANEVNPALLKHFKNLSLSKGNRVFLPLCGKTLDITWLLRNGYRVAGAELSRMAVEQLFTGLGLEPDISVVGGMTLYRAENIDIFVGDIFQLSGTMLGPVDAVYDRAALVALPEEMRGRYTKHLKTITDKTPQLLLSFEYDQTLMDGPPFSVSNDEIHEHYNGSYHLTFMESTNIPGGLKGKCPARENVWLLKKCLKR
ncbi:MAG: thiopurine S-methyltransferase [Candidatus Omnitrophota bacterium]